MTADGNGRMIKEEVLMLANYHTHTWRCHHAVGTEEEYVLNAIRAGVEILGFSDHSPYPMEPGYCSNFRMYLDQTRDYLDTVAALREKYKDRIRIYTGFEVEYYPKYFPGYLEFIKDLPVDYLLLGQHYNLNELEPEVFHVTKKTYAEEPFTVYTDQVCEGIRTGVFSYIAHPDIYNFAGDPEIYAREAEKICRAAKEMDLPLEINGLGIRDHRDYPRDDFWDVAAKVGNDVVFGCDAHEPDVVWDAASYEKAKQMCACRGLRLLETVPLHRPC